MLGCKEPIETHHDMAIACDLTISYGLCTIWNVATNFFSIWQEYPLEDLCSEVLNRWKSSRADIIKKRVLLKGKVCLLYLRNSYIALKLFLWPLHCFSSHFVLRLSQQCTSLLCIYCKLQTNLLLLEQKEAEKQTKLAEIMEKQASMVCTIKPSQEKSDDNIKKMLVAQYGHASDEEIFYPFK